jgi:PAS domain S-box-containing protein
VAETPQARTSDQQRFRDVFDASPIGIAVETLEGQPLFVNPALCFMLGFSEEELRSKHCEQFSPPEDAKTDWGLFQQLRAGSIDRYQLEKRYFRRDGSLVWGSLSVSLLRSRSSPLVLAMVEDITEKKTAEEARFRHAAIVESSEDAIASVTLDGVIASWNAGAQRIFGYTAREAVGMPVTILVPPEQPDEENKILETLKAGGRIDQFETIRVTKTGKKINVSLSISPIKDATGAIVACSGIARDITDRKRAEEALRSSEERLRLALQAAHIGTFEWNIQTGVNTWTPELEAIYGLPSGGFGGTQTAFEDLVHPDDRARVIELANLSLKTGQPGNGEWRVIWPDGSVHWISGRWQVFMNESGEPSRMIGVNGDITERKLAEEALIIANERLNLAIDSGSVGGWDFDLKTDRNVWFGKAHAQLGMASEETLGSRQEFWNHVHEDDRERLRHAIRVAKEKHKEFTEDFRVVWRDGTIHWLRSRGRYHYAANDEPERMLGISLDITQSKQAEKALRESEQRFRLAAQAGRIYTYEWDVATDVLTRSPEYVEILGSTEPMTFTRQQFLDKMHPDDRTKLLALITSLTPQNPNGDITYRLQVADGNFVWLRSSGRAFFDEKGKILSVVGIVADITDLKRAEQSVARMTRTLIESQEEERARIGRELHDDINQRLAMLSVELEQLQDNPPDAVKSRVRELRKQMNEISNDVQALSHDLHSSKLDYLGVVAGMKSWCKEFAERQRMEIDFSSDVQSAVPHEIGLSLFRVLQEALHNVIKHSGVRRVEVRLRQDSSGFQMVVCDLGRGFDLDAALQRKGLGLTSMRERVRLVNGTISIESKPMRGTTIHVRVPVGSESFSERAVG